MNQTVLLKEMYLLCFHTIQLWRHRRLWMFTFKVLLEGLWIRHLCLRTDKYNKMIKIISILQGLQKKRETGLSGLNDFLNCNITSLRQELNSDIKDTVNYSNLFRFCLNIPDTQCRCKLKQL